MNLDISVKQASIVHNHEGRHLEIQIEIRVVHGMETLPITPYSLRLLYPNMLPSPQTTPRHTQNLNQLRTSMNTVSPTPVQSASIDHNYGSQVYSASVLGLDGVFLRTQPDGGGQKAPGGVK